MRFACENCSKLYNINDQKPMILLPCTHTFCLQCINELKKQGSKCPLCKKEFTSEKPNSDLLKKLDSDDSRKRNKSPQSTTSNTEKVIQISIFFAYMFYILL